MILVNTERLIEEGETKMRIAEKDIYWKSENGNVIVTYDQFAIPKYHIYTKIKYIWEDGEKYDWRICNSFELYYQAVNYAKRIFDKPIMERDLREVDEIC